LNLVISVSRTPLTHCQLVLQKHLTPMSQSAPVPALEALAIEYPGYVQNVEAALDTMGGMDAIEKAHFDGGATYMQVNYRPG
jgi:Tau95 Triple barrel domain